MPYVPCTKKLFFLILHTLTLLSLIFVSTKTYAQSAIPKDKCAIITGATKDPNAALQAIKKFSDYGDPVVIKSNNGFLAPSPGIVDKSGSKAIVAELKANKIIPGDSYCGNADRFIAILYPNQEYTALLDEPEIQHTSSAEPKGQSDTKIASSDDERDGQKNTDGGEQQTSQASSSDTKNIDTSAMTNEEYCLSPTTPARCIDAGFGNGLVRVLTLNEFKKIFDGKVFKTGSRVTGGNSEFSIDFTTNEYKVLQSNGTVEVRYFKIFESSVCFDRGSGPCIEGSFAMIETDKDLNFVQPIRGILADTFIILGGARESTPWNPRKDTYFDCGIDYIENETIFLPRDCYLGVKGSTEKLMENGNQVHITDNEIKLVSDDASYFTSDEVSESGKDDTIRNIAEIYAEYRKQDILCGEAIDLSETEELMGSMINSLLIMMKAEEGDFDSIKDEAWDKSESIVEAEEQWEFMKTLYSGFSKSEKREPCNEMNSQTNQLYRMLEMQLKQQIEKDQPKEKKKRKF